MRLGLLGQRAVGASESMHAKGLDELLGGAQYRADWIAQAHQNAARLPTLGQERRRKRAIWFAVRRRCEQVQLRAATWNAWQPQVEPYAEQQGHESSRRRGSMVRRYLGDHRQLGASRRSCRVAARGFLVPALTAGYVGPRSSQSVHLRLAGAGNNGGEHDSESECRAERRRHYVGHTPARRG